MGYPTNAQCWAEAHSLGIDPIIVFAYAAQNAGLPADLGSLQNFQQSVYTWAGNVGIDPVYGFGFIQIHGGLPSSIGALQGYLNALGVRDPNTGLLSHEQPGSPGGMIRPGPGDGYIGNVQPTDPGVATRPYTPPGTPVPAQTGTASTATSGTRTPAPSAPQPAATTPTPAQVQAVQTAQQAVASAQAAVAANPGNPDAVALLQRAQQDLATATAAATAGSGAGSGQLGTAFAWVQKNPLEALAIAGGAYLLLFGVPSHRR